MKSKLYEATKVASYFLWEYTKCQNALSLWYCAEEIAFFLESRNIIYKEQIKRYTMLPKDDYEYIAFMRHIAYRIFIFTNNPDANHNWYVAEKLAQNGEWLDEICTTARVYSLLRKGEYPETKDCIRTKRIKNDFQKKQNKQTIFLNLRIYYQMENAAFSIL